MAKIITQKDYLFNINEGKKKERLDLFLANNIENLTRSRTKKLIENGFVTVNSKPGKANHIVKANDKIEVTIPTSPHPDVAEPEDIPLDIVYEDDYLLVLNKPPNMVVHPSYANWTGTLVNALLHHTKQLSDINEASRPGIVHRIDKDTSGLLVIAKDGYTHAKLAAQFAKHSIEREYWAIVWGRMKQNEGEINFNIARSKSDRKKFTHSLTDGKTATTYYTVLEEFEFTTLVKVKLKTGRTHQIRVHMAAINHPVFGDPTYGGRVIHYGTNLPKISARVDNLLEIMPRQALHAKTLGFIHPATNEFMVFNSNLPADFETLIKKLREN